MTDKTKNVADELKRIRSILSAITGFEDDDQEYVEDARKSVDRLIEGLAGKPLPAQQQEPVPAAMKTVIEAMQADPDYAWSWHCNVAMAFVDAGGDHYTGNQGAARFMKMLANVEPAYELPSPQPAQQQEPDAIVTSLTAGPDGVARSGLDRELPLMAGVYLTPQPAQRKPLTPAEVHGMAEAHGIDGDARHWYVVGLADAQEKHKEKNT